MPKISLSNVKIEKLKVKQTTLFWDQAIPGFALRVTPAGAKTLLFVYRHPDTKRQVKVRLGSWTIPAFKQCRARAATMRGHVDEGFDPVEFETAEREADREVFQDLLKGTGTLAELFPSFIETRRELGRSERTIQDYERLFKRHVRPALGQKRVKDVARGDVADLHRKMSRSPVRANRALTMLHTLFEYAIEQACMRRPGRGALPAAGPEQAAPVDQVARRLVQPSPIGAGRERAPDRPARHLAGRALPADPFRSPHGQGQGEHEIVMRAFAPRPILVVSRGRDPNAELLQLG